MSPRERRVGWERAAGLLAVWIGVALLALPVGAAEPNRVTARVEEGTRGGLLVTATVVDARGEPAADVPLVLKVRTTFGWLSLARGFTDAAGRIQAGLPPTLRAGEVVAEAGDEGEVQAVVRFGEARPVEPALRPGREVLRDLSPQPGFISPYPVPLQVALLAVILGGIWATYGYIVWLLSRIRAGS